jgi:hypothetical protein
VTLPDKTMLTVAFTTTSVWDAPHDTLHDLFPDPVGTIPLAIPWFGALGALTYGILLTIGAVPIPSGYRWSYRADIPRPFIGATLGIVGYIIFYSIIKAATGGTQAPTGTVTDIFIYFVVSFVVAYSDGTFGQLISRATTVILGPGGTQQPAALPQAQGVQIAAATPPATGATGEFFHDAIGRLWYCTAGSTATTPATWREVSLT